MGRPAAVGNCTECGLSQIHALQMCNTCYQREYQSRRRLEAKERTLHDRLTKYRESIPKDENLRNEI